MQALLASLQRTTMFLLQRRGPTSFVLKDSNTGLNSTVQIGAMQACTCQRRRGAQREKICAHILFVMVKVLQLPAENALVWQQSLTGAYAVFHT